MLSIREKNLYNDRRSDVCKKYTSFKPRALRQYSKVYELVNGTCTALEVRICVNESNLVYNLYIQVSIQN